MKIYKKVALVVVVVTLAMHMMHFNQKVMHFSHLIMDNIEALASDEIVDGGVIPGVGITCDTGGSGKCYIMRYQEGLADKCYFFCKATGNPNDYCSSFYVGLVNFCTIMGGIYSLDENENI